MLLGGSALLIGTGEPRQKTSLKLRRKFLGVRNSAIVMDDAEKLRFGKSGNFLPYFFCWLRSRSDDLWPFSWRYISSGSCPGITGCWSTICSYKQKMVVWRKPSFYSVLCRRTFSLWCHYVSWTQEKSSTDVWRVTPQSAFYLYHRIKNLRQC